MERMEEKVPESNEQALQHFITTSPWDERVVVAQVAADGDKLLGGTDDSCLLLDETSFIKKGKKSVGVARLTGRDPNAMPGQVCNRTCVELMLERHGVIDDICRLSYGQFHAA